MNPTDAEFVSVLTHHLTQFSEGQSPVVPLFTRADGSIDREKTLALPCYAGLEPPA